jgi:carbon starvation protein CstA
LAVIALAVVSVHLVNEGRAKYLWVTLVPMAVVFTTTSSAAVFMLQGYVSQISNQLHNPPGARNGTLLFNSVVQASILVGLMACTLVILIAGAARALRSPGRRPELPDSAEPRPMSEIGTA